MSKAFIDISSAGLCPIEEMADRAVPLLEGEVAEVEDDPDGWRIYADVIDDEQIEWLRKHPEHDRFNVLSTLK